MFHSMLWIPRGVAKKRPATTGAAAHSKVPGASGGILCPPAAEYRVMPTYTEKNCPLRLQQIRRMTKARLAGITQHTLKRFLPPCRGCDLMAPAVAPTVHREGSCLDKQKGQHTAIFATANALHRGASIATDARKVLSGAEALSLLMRKR